MGSVEAVTVAGSEAAAPVVVRVEQVHERISSRNANRMEVQCRRALFARQPRRPQRGKDPIGIPRKIPQGSGLSF